QESHKEECGMSSIPFLIKFPTILILKTWET
ncbi:unnamed protein product, partial [marine sediment metagenome]